MALIEMVVCDRCSAKAEGRPAGLPNDWCYVPETQIEKGEGPHELPLRMSLSFSGKHFCPSCWDLLAKAILDWEIVRPPAPQDVAPNPHDGDLPSVKEAALYPTEFTSPGFYWVRMASDSRLTVAEWSGRAWFYLGVDGPGPMPYWVGRELNSLEAFPK